MRIAVFVKKTTFHKGAYGLETQNKQLVEAFAQHGHQVVVFSPKWELAQDSEEQAGVKYKFLTATYRYLFTFTKHHWKRVAYTTFVKEHTKEKFDVILSQSSAAWGLFSKKADLGVPIVSVAHGSILGEAKTYYSDLKFKPKTIKNIYLFIKDTGFILFNFFTRQREYVHGSDKVICVSNRVKQALIDETFADENKFVVVHNGIDGKRFVKTKTDSNESRVLYVGAIIRSKGLADLYKLSLDKRFEHTIFDIVGDGEYLPALKQMNKNPNFILHGKKPYEEVSQFFTDPKYKVFLFPTHRFEGLPMVLIEALFAGIPVIAYDSGGVADAVHTEVTGYLVRQNDLEALKTKTHDVLTNSDLQAKLSIQSTKTAIAEFSADVMIKRYEEILYEVA